MEPLLASLPVDQHALMVQRVGSEQLSFALQRAHRDWLWTLVFEGQIKLWLVDFNRKVFTVGEDLRIAHATIKALGTSGEQFMLWLADFH